MCNRRAPEFFINEWSSSMKTVISGSTKYLRTHLNTWQKNEYSNNLNNQHSELVVSVSINVLTTVF